MALFNNKLLETLQIENTELKDKIISLETRLSIKDKVLSENRIAIDELEKQIELLNIEIEKYKFKLANSFSSHQVNKVRQYYDNYISEIESEIAALQNRPHNERGAGRKRKATPEQIEMILSLVNQGKSYYAIAKILSDEYNERWNKTTVRNTVLSFDTELNSYPKTLNET